MEEAEDGSAADAADAAAGNYWSHLVFCIEDWNYGGKWTDGWRNALIIG